MRDGEIREHGQPVASAAALVSQLRAQRDRYSAKKRELREHLRQINAELAKIEEGEAAIHRLLLLEVPAEELREESQPFVSFSVVPIPSTKPFVETAYAVLQELGVPVYYHELAQKVRERGIVVPGKNPAQNLYAHLRRDPRFRLTGPGTFGLRPQVNGMFVDIAPASVQKATPVPSGQRIARQRHGRKRRSR